MRKLAGCETSVHLRARDYPIGVDLRLSLSPGGMGVSGMLAATIRPLRAPQEMGIVLLASSQLFELGNTRRIHRFLPQHRSRNPPDTANPHKGASTAREASSSVMMPLTMILILVWLRIQGMTSSQVRPLSTSCSACLSVTSERTCMTPPIEVVAFDERM